MPEYTFRVHSSFLRFFSISLLGGALFYGTNLLQPAGWGAMPLLGFFVGTIWLYVFGVFAGLFSTLLGVIFVAFHARTILPYIGWMIGYTVAILDVSVVLLMLRGFYPCLRGDPFKSRLALLLISILGIAAIFFYALAFFRPLIDWAIVGKSIVYCFKSCAFTTSILLAIFTCAIPLAILIDHIVSLLLQENAPSWDDR